MKKLLAVGILTAILLFNRSTTSAAGPDKDSSINTDNLSSGIIALSYNDQTSSKLKVMVEKDGKKVTYNLKNDGTTENFPLQMGDGEYKVSILENVTGTKYRYLSTKTVNLELPDENQIYLGSVQNINWNRNMKAIGKAAELTKGLEDDSRKIKTIYDYLVNNVTYDYDKLPKLTNDYLPDIENTVASGKGICYDFASTFAAMLRSQGIPAKLVKGYTTNVKGYHAWNEVYNTKTEKWFVVDATYDSEMHSVKAKYSMEKNAGQYNKVYEY